jgi:hypothetical protein
VSFLELYPSDESYTSLKEARMRVPKMVKGFNSRFRPWRQFWALNLILLQYLPFSNLIDASASGRLDGGSSSAAENPQIDDALTWKALG